MTIDLNRSPAYIDHNIPIDSNNYYRALTVDSYNDLWRVDENGQQVMKGYGKGGSDRLSFQRSYPNDLYVNRLVKANTIIEGTDAMPIENRDEESGYAFITELRRDQVESGETPLRVYQRRALGQGAIEAVHVWELVHDFFPNGK